MIDVHCHLNLHKFDEDYDEVIKDAKQAGVTTIINTGTSIVSSKKAVKLANQYENLYAIVGIHPHHADKVTESHPERSLAGGGRVEGSPEEAERDSSASPQNDNIDWLEKLEMLAKEPNVVGIGEIGMDYYSYKSNGIVEKKLQEDAFRKQIELSIKLKLPLQIHTRLAWEDTLGIILEYKNQLQNPPGMFHCYSGSIEFTRKVLDAGFYVGFDGNITYQGIPPGESTSLLELVSFVPMDRIVTETDSPFLTPEPHRGRRNTPSYVILVGEAIAKLKRISFQKVQEQTTQNAHLLFNLKPNT